MEKTEGARLLVRIDKRKFECQEKYRELCDI